MNINEVLIALGEGKIVFCESKNKEVKDNKYFKIIDGAVNHCYECDLDDEEMPRWHQSDVSFDDLWRFYKSFSISETGPVEEHENKKLEKNYGALGFNPKIIDFNVFPEIEESSTEQDKASKFITALKTLMELKSHPLAVPASDDNKYQYFICFCITILKINNYSLNSFKLSEISPAFNDKIDAQQAIEDIGENRLIEMFKVFQGIYD